MSLYGINLDQVGASPPATAERAPGAYPHHGRDGLG
jgi:hypothetical protein